MYIFDIFVFTYLYFQYMNDNKLPKNVNKGWSNKTKKMNIIVGTENNPTDFTSGETIINKKSTKKNLDKLIEINNDVNPDVSNGKTTTDAEAGGLLKGKPHYDSNGNPTGGIPGIVDGQKPIETEGEEFVVNAEASKKHWKELSKINQQDGNGVPIGPPISDYDDDPTEEFENGGKIQFNPNYLPSKWIMSYAKKIKSKHPEIWKLGGNIFGNEAFENLKRVSERGYWLDSEEWMYVKWRSYVARHKQDFRIEGVVAMLKWVDKVDKGWAYMKSLIEVEIKKKSPKKMKEGGILPAQGTLLTHDKTKKLDYKKVGVNYSFVVFDGEENPVENYKRHQFKKRKGNEVTMDYNQFIEYLYSETYLNDKMAEGGNIDFDVNELLGRFVNVFVMGVSEPEYFKIKEVKISPEQYRYRDVTLRGDVGVTKFPLDKLEDFIAGKQILIEDNNEDYAIALTNERLASGGSTKNYVSYKDKYNRKYNYPKNASHSLEDISKDTGVSMKGLQKIFNKGIGAHKTNPESVRPNVKAKEQWAMARVYSAVMGGKASIVDANELKMADGGVVGQEIICLNCGWDWNTNKSEEFDKYVCHNCDTDNSMTYAPKKHNEGGNVDQQDTITMNIPALIRTLELVREDVHSDAELHFVVENLLNIKNKKVITMDDYAYIADIEHKHVKKHDKGGTTGTNKKEVSIGFGGLGNGTTVWDKNRIQNGDYKIIAHISDFGKITYYDTKLPEDAITKIEAFAEQEKARLAEGGELSQGYDFSPIQTPLN
jgi:hypothetical protein